MLVQFGLYLQTWSLSDGLRPAEALKCHTHKSIILMPYALFRSVVEDGLGGLFRSILYVHGLPMYRDDVLVWLYLPVVSLKTMGNGGNGI